MKQTLKIRRTYKYRLYTKRHLHQQINVAPIEHTKICLLEDTRFPSFTLKQAGWKLLDSEQKYGRVQIGKRVYKFVQHRSLWGDMKTVTIKRDPAGRLWICFSVVEPFVVQNEVSTGQSGGFDFGLKHFLTTHEGQQIDMPLFYRDDLPHLRSVQGQVSKKIKGNANRQKGKHPIARLHIRIDDKRQAFHFKLAHKLCDKYAILCFEDLAGMKWQGE